MLPKLALLALFIVLAVSSPVRKPGRVNDLPVVQLFQPEKGDRVPIELGERRCGNIYHGYGALLPCLLRPHLPPYSYVTERNYNTEYRK